MAAAHGETALLVTVDITTESDNYIPHVAEARQIHKVVGNANDLGVVNQVLEYSRAVDLLYVDADHSEMPTLLNCCIYNSLLQPKIALFDDITLTEGMKSFWYTMRSAYPDHTVNCVDVLPDTRKPAPNCGFGLWVSPSFAEEFASK